MPQNFRFLRARPVTTFTATLLLGAVGFLTTCSEYQTKPSEGFSGPVQSLVFDNCVSCHAGGVAEGGFGFVDNPQAMIDELYLVPGDAEGSLLYQKMAGTAAEGARMPFGGPYLDAAKLADVRDWINELPSPPAKFNVSATIAHATITPSEAQTVTEGEKVAYTVVADENYGLSKIVEGTCPAGEWLENVYTTGEIKEDCNVAFIVKGIFTVTPSVVTHLTVSPSDAQKVLEGESKEFALTAAAGYEVGPAVSGDCPAGTWNGQVYKTGPIVKDCTLGFLLKGQLTVSAAGSHLDITPSTQQTVNEGATQAYTVTPVAGYTVSTSVGGDCPAGTWNGSVYTTAPLTQSCSVSFAAIGAYTITSTLGAHVLSVSTGLTTQAGPAGLSLTVVGEAGYGVQRAVGGDCPAGTWSENTYTISALTGSCNLSFTGANACSTIVPNVKFSTDVAPLLQTPQNSNSRSCITCHKSVSASGGYKMLDPSDLTRANYALVVQNTAGNGNNVASHVKPFDPLNSWLFTKTTSTPPSGNRMPRLQLSDVFFTDAQQQIICNWIAQGAFNN